MRSCDVIRIRRETLGYSKEEFAELVGLNVNDIIRVESGERVLSSIFWKVKDTINRLYTEMDRETHLRMRIAELGMRIKEEEDKDILLNNISHLLIELGKLQGDLMGFESGRGYN